MTQRNPMNERYTVEGNRKGVTRKSAASAKPAARAAASVRVENTPKKGRTAKERKAAEKELKDKEREVSSILERKYGNPPTKEYKNARMAWAFLLVIALLATFGTWFAQYNLPAYASYALLVVAYTGIIGVLIVDFKVLRKQRKEYVQKMQTEIARDRRTLENAQKEIEWMRARGEQVPEGYLPNSIGMPAPQGLFHRKPKQAASTTESSVADDASAAQPTDASSKKEGHSSAAK